METCVAHELLVFCGGSLHFVRVAEEQRAGVLFPRVEAFRRQQAFRVAWLLRDDLGGNRKPAGWAFFAVDGFRLAFRGFTRRNRDVLPHPTLTNCYASTEAKPDFVNQLFDKGAKHYDGIVDWDFLRSGQIMSHRIVRSHPIRFHFSNSSPNHHAIGTDYYRE